MKHIVKTETDWLKLRKDYITASEAAVLVGADPYNSPKKVREPSTFTGNAFTAVGQLLEYAVVQVTNQVLDMNFELYEQEADIKEFYTYENLGATPDAHQNREILLECKTTRPRTFIKYGSVPPDKYLIQLQVQMLTTGIDTGYLSIMSTNLTQNTATLNWPVSVFKMLRNDEICDILIKEAERFKTNKTFRVNSAIKQKVKLMLAAGYERVI